MVIGPDGHYRGGVLAAPSQPQEDGTTPEELAAIERHIVYTSAQFRATFDWQNDHHKATLMALPDAKQTPVP